MKLSEIDKLRGQASKIALESHPQDPVAFAGNEYDGMYSMLRRGLEMLENEIEAKLRLYHAQPDCPFCRHRYGWATAKLVDSKTQGRLECERCGAQALVGHCAAKRWDE